MLWRFLELTMNSFYTQHINNFLYMKTEDQLSAIPLRLKLIREKMGASQSQFAQMSGHSQAQVSSWELGKTFPGLESLIKLAAAAGTTISEIIGEEMPATAPPRPATEIEMALWIIHKVGINGFKLDRVKEVLLEKPYRM